jgi:hypothetical protein
MFCFDMGEDPLKMILMAIIFTSSLFIHEYGHALAAIRFGRKAEITLEALGGYASYPGPRLKDKEQFIVILAGPFFTALLIGVSYYLLHSQIFPTYWPNYFCYWTMKLNTYWLVINLAPLHPLDGGQMAAILFQKGGPKGEKFGLVLGNITAVIGASYFLFHQSFFFALLFLFFGLKNFQATNAHPLRKKIFSPFSQLNEASRLYMEGEIDLAKKIYSRLSREKDTYIRNLALEGLAQILDHQGKPKEAYRILLKGDITRMHQGKHLFWKLAYSEQEYEKMVVYATEIYRMHPTFETALMNAKACAHMKDIPFALGWLNTARQFDEANNVPWEELISDPIFSSSEI